jgi:hypothetical protein
MFEGGAVVMLDQVDGSLANPLPRPLIDGPSAWVGATLRDRPETWTYTLSADEIAEIEAAVAAVLTAGLDVADVTRGNFPLPRFGRTLDALCREILEGRGFALIRGLPVAGKSMLQNAIAYCGIGGYFGKACSQNAKGHLLGHVRDLGGPTAAVDPTVRAYHTAERQMFHTDGSDIVGLLCLQQAKSGGLSSIVSSMAMYNRMATERPDLVRRLFAPLPFDRRGEVPEGMRPFYLIPVCTDYAGQLSVGYTRRNINSSQRHPDAPKLSSQDIEALDMLDTLANDSDLRLDMVLQPGDMQFLHNHTILHDRTAFEDWPEPERKRHLLRLWLAAANGRPLDPTLAQRFGSVEIGNRGGIHCAGARLHAPLEPC